MLRRLRGLIGTALTWGVVGVACSVVLFLSNYKAWPIDAVHWQRSLTILAGFLAGGALWGGASGVAFGLVLLSAVRRRGYQYLSSSRITAWGAIAGAAFPLLLYTPILLQGAQNVLPLYALVTGVSAIAGAVCARVSYALAQRAPVEASESIAAVSAPHELLTAMPLVIREPESLAGVDGRTGDE